MKKLLVILLSLVMMFSFGFSLIGCDVELPEDDLNEELDPNRTQLYVGVFDGALQFDWAKEWKKEYEAARADWVNPDNGKVGVQIMIVRGKNEYGDGSLSTQIKQSQNAIYFLSSNSYDTFVSIDASGDDSNSLIEDITDVVTEKIYDDNGDLVADKTTATKSIMDTMYPEWRDMFAKDKNGEKAYYALPNWMSNPGIVYDADLFEEYGYEVPETYNELIDLMDRMVNDGITPFTFSTLDYITLNSIEYMYASYEGKKDFYLNSTLQGEDDELGEINYNNAYKLAQQEGRKAMLKFAYDLAHNDNYTTTTTRSGLSHIAAQAEYVSSINTAESGKNRVAMFLENSYWERETIATFNSMAEFDENWGWGKRNFRYMPAPKFVDVDGINDQKNDKTTMLCGTTSSMTFINKSVDAVAKTLAKDFLQFVHSRRGRALYLIHSSCLSAYDFTLTDTEYAQLTPFAKSIYDLSRDENTELVHRSGLGNPIFRKKILDFSYDWTCYTQASFKGTVGDDNDVNGRAAFNLFRGNTHLTVEDYFEGMAKYFNADKWANEFANLV
ncbi:MAG: extracellular solute-binding protein [Clostridia bacterium]|nr:extracellular solute-binding protein [Clostridia bacterium]